MKLPSVRQSIKDAVFFVCLTALVAATFKPIDVSAQGCTTRALTTRPLAVFVAPPRANTREGFVYSQQKLTLQQNSQIYVCKEVTVGFGLVTERWAQISIWIPSQKRWEYGWVQRNGLQVSQLERGSDRTSVAIFQPLSQAHAASASLPSDSPHKETTGSPPGTDQLREFAANALATDLTMKAELPKGLIPSIPAETARVAHETTSSFLLRAQVIVFLVVAILLGILAQALYELLGTERRLSRRAAFRLFMRPLLISPIVLLIFLQTVDLELDDLKKALLFCLLAFQAGFSWHKMLETSTAGKQDTDKTEVEQPNSESAVNASMGLRT